MDSYNLLTGYFDRHILIGGVKFPVNAPVIPMRTHGKRFKVGKGARRRFPKQKIDLIVLHWTGGEASALSTFRTLTRRDLGAEFVIDNSGVIWQFADPATIDTFDAGYVNPRSVGIEITNYGFRSSRSKVPSAGRYRPMYETVMNGQTRHFAGFYPVQIQAALALCGTLRAALRNVKRQIPRDPDGNILRRVMTKAEILEYAGVLGHFHVSRAKSDPGLDIFDAFDAAGYG